MRKTLRTAVSPSWQKLTASGEAGQVLDLEMALKDLGVWNDIQRAAVKTVEKRLGLFLDLSAHRLPTLPSRGRSKTAAPTPLPHSRRPCRAEQRTDLRNAQHLATS
ncbi:hypothetical protein [Streptomyces canus]|uniref:hypothetical protein n=1 Tax=Streptomyces canus TaxID=58343 RepID=UPI002E264AA8